MARILRVTKRLQQTIHDFRLLCIILLLFVQTSAKQPSYDNTHDSRVCHSNFFECYQDCCLKGEQFCNHQEKRCSSCTTRQALCGNDSLPVQCLLFCYKLSNPPLDLTDYVAFSTFIKVVATLGILCVALAFLLVCAIRNPDWPPFLRYLRKQNGKGGNDPSMESMISKEHGPSHTDADGGCSPACDGSSGTTLSDSRNSSIKGLNLNRRASDDDNENSDDHEQGRGRLSDNNSLRSPAAEDSQDPRQGQTTASSLPRRPLPRQVHGTVPSPDHVPHPHPNAAGNQSTSHGPHLREDIDVRHEGVTSGLLSENPLQDSPVCSNEVYSKPQFNKINPTTGPCDNTERHHLATGTDNPAKNYYFIRQDAD